MNLGSPRNFSNYLWKILGFPTWKSKLHLVWGGGGGSGEESFTSNVRGCPIAEWTKAQKITYCLPPILKDADGILHKACEKVATDYGFNPPPFKNY